MAFILLFNTACVSKPEHQNMELIGPYDKKLQKFSHTKIIKNGVSRLDKYVYSKDPSTSLKLLDSKNIGGVDFYQFELLSQDWDMGKAIGKEGDTKQRHSLIVAVPPQEFRMSEDTSLLIIAGGSNPVKVQDIKSYYSFLIDTEIKVVTAVLSQIPNEPVVFSDDPRKKERKEDDIIAYTWRKVADGDEVERAARFPMTKAVNVAMDKISEFTKQEKNLPDIEKFIVAGSSKRGWTTWTTAAIDRGAKGKNRVVGIIPMVILQNTRKMVADQKCSYGEFSTALKDYVEEKTIPELIYSKKYDELLD